MQAKDYAKALRELGSKPEHLRGLSEALRRRGHQKLLPRVLSEYEKLELRDKRLAKQKEITPEEERTRVLLELYRKLVDSPAPNK